jgi:hypothetical protein
MLTLFAIPKAFHGEIGRIQRNAIRSWTLLTPQPEIILLGDDAGTADVAQEFGVKHLPHIDRNTYGTPLMNSMFEVAQQAGQGDIFAYVNADIIFTNDLIQAIQTIPFQRFMMTGQRWNVDYGEVLDSQQDWETDLRDRVNRFGKLAGPQATDYFVFSRDTFTEIPPFAIGRLCFDNWMLYKALNLKIPLIDATDLVMAIHQNHDYNHHPKGRDWIFLGPEAQRNLQLLGGEHYTYFMLDLANWQLTAQGLSRPPFSWERLDRQLDMLPLARPDLKPIARMGLSLLRSGSQLKRVVSKIREIPARIISRLVKVK